MNRVEVLELEGGQTLGIEVDVLIEDVDDTLVSTRGGDPNTVAFSEAMDRIKPMANQLIGTLKDLAETPDTVAVKFGLKLSAGAGVIVAKASTEANFEVSLTWTKGG
ncbi:CU044_2847 family protein [uncultured Roseobacter sp.]|uniref:CU044_2847 family protein n=1 Tax=uncultured Roseobacter sp. TaxID=114847 RepID=UPI0026358F06|nr:CU044_2847 family protein [uncultured Roseobacter sp.]